jgi:hypothetical protein
VLLDVVDDDDDDKGNSLRSVVDGSKLNEFSSLVDGREDILKVLHSNSSIA